jgi:hypothetical protein
MAITERSAHVKSDKGLQADALGRVGRIPLRRWGWPDTY